jgi:hypothetical protein
MQHLYSNKIRAPQRRISTLDPDNTTLDALVPPVRRRKFFGSFFSAILASLASVSWFISRSIDIHALND